MARPLVDHLFFDIVNMKTETRAAVVVTRVAQFVQSNVYLRKDKDMPRAKRKPAPKRVATISASNSAKMIANMGHEHFDELQKGDTLHTSALNKLCWTLITWAKQDLAAEKMLGRLYGLPDKLIDDPRPHQEKFNPKRDALDTIYRAVYGLDVFFETDKKGKEHLVWAKEDKTESARIRNMVGRAIRDVQYPVGYLIQSKRLDSVSFEAGRLLVNSVAYVAFSSKKKVEAMVETNDIWINGKANQSMADWTTNCRAGKLAASSRNVLLKGQPKREAPSNPGGDTTPINKASDVLLADTLTTMVGGWLDTGQEKVARLMRKAAKDNPEGTATFQLAVQLNRLYGASMINSHVKAIRIEEDRERAAVDAKLDMGVEEEETPIVSLA